MVQAQAVETAFVDQSKDEGVRGLEDIVRLHSDGRERVHVEEASVVDLLGGDAPEGEPVALIAEQLVESVEAGRDARLTSHVGKDAVDRSGNPRTVFAEFRQPPLDDLFFARALGAAVGSRLAARWEVAEG